MTNDLNGAERWNDEGDTLPLSPDAQRAQYEKYGRQLDEHKAMMEQITITAEYRPHSRLWLLWRWFVQRIAVLR